MFTDVDLYDLRHSDYSILKIYKTLIAHYTLHNNQSHIFGKFIWDVMFHSFLVKVHIRFYILNVSVVQSNPNNIKTTLSCTIFPVFVLNLKRQQNINLKPSYKTA